MSQTGMEGVSGVWLIPLIGVDGEPGRCSGL